MPKVQLVELFAHGLGVIDDARLEFGSGFNVITGETGAGKTLLLGALGLSLGGDVTSSRYALSPDTRTVALFVRHGSEEIVVSREATSSGRLRSSLNGAPSSVEALRTLAEELVVIHGQHDSLNLRSRGEIVRIIDRNGDVDTGELDAVRRQLREAGQLREDFGGDPASRDRELEFIHFQLDEFDRAAIASANELIETLDELTRLTALRDGQAALATVLALFDSEGDDAVLAQFARALGRLPEGEAYDSVRASLSSVLIQARESIHDLSALTNPETFEATRMEELEERAGTLQRIARKYGGTIEAALDSRDELRAQLERLAGEADRLSGLDEEIHVLEEREAVLSQRARQEREFAAENLTKAVRAQLARVALTDASLRFVVGGTDGSDAEILFTPNPGRPEGPLATLASGGELSRVLLAISLETASEDVVAIFDEIDAGLGGQVAQQIGECLSEVGRRQQVLAITHLASVAARADHHFVIEKRIEGGVTGTVVRALNGSDRVKEIARMLAGDELTVESRALAQQMLENSPELRTGAEFSR
jgi:DNA repair protein RecN (Recombination protein N)